MYKDKADNDQTGYNLSGLKTGNAYIYNNPEIDNTSGITLLSEYDNGNVNIFEGDIHLANSNTLLHLHKKELLNARI